MVKIGYALGSEENGPRELVRCVVKAEEGGFDFAQISDHYHPWTPEPGHSPFVWSVLGGIASMTSRIEVGTGVTCPTMRIHPAVIAQASATAGAMMPGRFFLGVGSGEALNEHILGDPWPGTSTRLEMLEEAIAVIRELWTGEETDFDGVHYTVNAAQIYDLPEQPIPIIVAATGEVSARIAGENDGVMNTVPDAGVIDAFEAAGGAGKSRYGQVSLCWAPSIDEARSRIEQYWPTSALSGILHSDVTRPRMFADMASVMRPGMAADAVVHGASPEPFVEAVREFVDAGYTHVALHQVGPEQDGFLDFWDRELRAALGEIMPASEARPMAKAGAR